MDQDDIREIFADRLRILVERVDKKQEVIGKEAGVGQSAISDYMKPEKGRTPTFNAIRKLAEYFGVTSDYLLGLSDTASTKENEKIAAKTLRLKDQAFQTLFNVNHGKLPDGREYDEDYETPSRFDYRNAIDFFLSNNKALGILLELYYFLCMKYKPTEKFIVDSDNQIISKGFSEKDYNRMAMLRIVEKALAFKEELGNIGGEENGNRKGKHK